ncbi:MAG: DUF2142 domain-containing protein [Deltaproteobacteria bacterium]|nr:DUF2142 domain-containing protein [Deltaproteobacteria bacterium]
MAQKKKSRSSSGAERSSRPARAAAKPSFSLPLWLLGRETWFVAAVCLLVAVKIFFYSASLPFFNNVDEEAHFDLIWKYAEGQWPEKGADITDAEALDFIVVYSSPEFKRRAQQYPGGVYPPPLWTMPPEVRRARIDQVRQRDIRNYEVYSPPLYYLLAGGWLGLGRSLGLQGAGLLYWTRFLNIAALVVLVWLAWLAGRRFFPDDQTIRLGLPLAILFLPQDVFHTLNNDVFSPVLSGAAFYFLGRIVMEPRGRWTLFPWAGLFTAGALLVKLSNLPLLGTMIVAWFLALRSQGRWAISPGLIGRLSLGSLAAAVPLGAWFWRNYVHLGDLTGSQHKIEFLGWTLKPMSELFSHPIFSLSGVSYFVHHLIASFWRGEVVWALERFSRPAADYFYSISSLILLTVSAAGWLSSLKAEAQSINAPEKEINNRTSTHGPMILSLVTVGAAILYLATLSQVFDFNKCVYPSRAFPYFVSGRLILCALIPFFILYLDGWRRLTGRFLPRISPLTLFMIMGLVLMVADFIIRFPIIASEYNFWHVPLGAL